MPELPEVETARRGLLPHVVGRQVRGVTVRNASLRWPVTRGLERKLRDRKILAIRRRGKYLLFDFETGHLLVHLGGALGPPRAIGAHDARERARLGGQHAARLRHGRRKPRLLPASPRGLWARRQALPRVQDADPRAAPGPALHFLLPAVPAMSGAWTPHSRAFE